jgi:hypothetical protein
VSLGCGGPNSAVGELANENVDSVLDDRPAVKMAAVAECPGGSAIEIISST